MKWKSLFLSLMFLMTMLPLRVKAQDLKPAMHRNYQALIELQPYVADPARFKARENYSEISTLIAQLAGIADVLPQMMEDKPGMMIIGKVYADYLNDIQRGFKNGPTPYVRNKIRTATSFCFECHSTLATTKNYKSAEKKVQNWNLTPHQLADFYAATRQFDKAMKSYEFVLMASSSENLEGEDVSDVARALKNALSLAIRVKRDPDQALKLLSLVSSREDLPAFFAAQIKQWKKDVLELKKEKKLSETADAKVWLDRALYLIARGKKMQTYEADHVADITYLHAINYIHEALKRENNSELRSQAYAMLGTAYAVLEDPLLWTLDTVYFEACVREVPHTALARQCFDHYAQEMYFGFSGSAGLELPPEDAAKLKELQNLAESERMNISKKKGQKNEK
ncbi:MAG: hypothetical protein IPJ69_11375 [Deltaproteobacteria bacterium]|nr:MAG: hypothetical protein IPJ69_11375 [Deltaproteobacteria bacterium]